MPLILWKLIAYVGAAGYLSRRPGARRFADRVMRAVGEDPRGRYYAWHGEARRP